MKDILKIPDIPTLYPEKEDYHTARIASISISDMSGCVVCWRAPSAHHIFRVAGNECAEVIDCLIQQS